ncbi:Uncharacterised protein [Salmonella enterica subsp. enterica serovar Typhi]|uniref:DUF5983 domain-containing protein n=2 Tax=Salmonella enterica TaxID=28901 RepID=A0A5U5W2S3_SALER|nr:MULTISPECIES: hypothetical protein [Enterobacteriaceae]EAN1005022.1 hypothetical protein [Salmonella enterica subsp. enterica serovar Typhimurium var. 5-]EAN6155577.1 hypothetical protein [Salmonella enterica]CRJ41703.1 Uncharacterised protein [Salmonella enterica subsp. enterica serovar Typhi]HAD4279941.1 hypothetical protein [Salmonella enterica subsp. enterica serovar Typhi str. CT18]EAN9958552.1 hypothetical protein [Salmonella enterica]
MLKFTEVYKTAVISTAHVTAADSERLPIACFDPLTDRGLNWVHGTQYGWIVRAGMRGSDWKEELSEYGISKEAISNIQAILDAGFDAVQFDSDAELVDGLPAWDW